MIKTIFYFENDESITIYDNSLEEYKDTLKLYTEDEELKIDRIETIEIK